MPTDRLSFGLPLDAPIKQTILPAVGKPSGRVYGYFIIAETTFDGNEVEVVLDPDPVPVQSVTLPSYGRISGRQMIGGGLGLPVQQYMAAVWDDNELVSADPGRQVQSAPWLAHSSFIKAADSGYSHQFIHALHTFRENLTLGNLIQSLVYGMDTTAAPVPGAPVPPVPQDAAFNWFAKVHETALLGECPYFDFSWVNLFNSSAQKFDAYNNVVPQSISIVSVPNGFKAMTVSMPTVVPGTDVTFDTLRIMITNADAVVSGTDYEFEFLVSTSAGAKQVTLTLSVITDQLEALTPSPT